ncbi:MAG: acyl-CoA dehydrogenase family protein, partial [Solirubrobacteraceae bacterium]|nr:acyl-CoA dehydrogenase family protein [Solirubrobacteraceae bacterium]
ENLIGEPGQGFIYMMERLEQERLSCAISNIAHAVGAFESTLQYVQDRRAFGQPIGRFQNSQFKLAEISTELDAAQAYVDHCVLLHNAGKLTAIDAAKVKLLSSEVQGRVIDVCVQLHGGYGYMEEYGVARAYNDARVTRIWAGSNEIMKLVIGRSLGITA